MLTPNQYDQFRLANEEEQAQRRYRSQLPALRRALKTQDSQEQELNQGALPALRRGLEVNRQADDQRRTLLDQMDRDRPAPGRDRVQLNRPDSMGNAVTGTPEAGLREVMEASPGQEVTSGEMSGTFSPAGPGQTGRISFHGKPQTKDEMEAILERRGGLGQIEDARRRALGLRPFEETSPENRLLMKQYSDLGTKKYLESREAGLVAGGMSPEEAARQVRMEANQMHGLPNRFADNSAVVGEQAQRESAAEHLRKMQEGRAAEEADLELQGQKAGVRLKEQAVVENEQQAADRRKTERQRRIAESPQGQAFAKAQERAAELRKTIDAVGLEKQKQEIRAENRPERAPQRMHLDEALQEGKALERLVEAAEGFEKARASGDPKAIADAEQYVKSAFAFVPEDLQGLDLPALRARVADLNDRVDTMESAWEFMHPPRQGKEEQPNEFDIMMRKLGK